MPRIPLSLTDQLYAGVLETPPWVSFLEALEDHLPCHSATLVLRRPRCGDPGILISPRAASAEGFRLLRERLFDHSPFLDLPEARVCILHEMLSPADRPRYARYLKFLRTYGTADLIGLDLTDPVSGLRLRLRGARKPSGTRYRGGMAESGKTAGGHRLRISACSSERLWRPGRVFHRVYALRLVRAKWSGE